ncbi:hypothetical protein CEH05_04995 [Halobacillus halophilus]|uniref:Uncharacterized protein n=1 Tax=Halobacillus halophilus (strain ATCC 35676 / DSM 2266 / JCM 20832 / KCTC 3685 / LMG 17431 / NBRC 102448 / NCIMB 2269) TaxID=866895 RepID=I0JJN6_HALH3|nr:retron St85 family effector protein [Halobacillus halophilus]ASF38509.1 hypothetical protein CEH05_04995 [Halobacillus halophilus]CCG44355.1 conserved hypothetical protein [Halobacillus halophilus DSM 2266]
MSTRIYTPALIQKLKEYHTKNHYRTANMPVFLFLCGKEFDVGSQENSTSNRVLVKNFYKNIGRDDVFCIFAEDLWSNQVIPNLDLLSFEDFLAELSDYIVLFIESFGTACELGAFAMRDELLKKLIVLEFEEFKGVESFINDGPVKKVLNNHSSNVFYVQEQAIFSNSDLYDLLISLGKKKKAVINTKEQSVKLNSFLIEIIELISLLGPINSKDLVNMYKEIKGFNSFNFSLEQVNNKERKGSKVNVQNILNLLCMAGIIKNINNYYSLEKKHFSYIKFMFELTNEEFYSIRATLLSRIYKYDKGAIEA